MLDAADVYWNHKSWELSPMLLHVATCPDYFMMEVHGVSMLFNYTHQHVLHVGLCTPFQEHLCTLHMALIYSQHQWGPV